MARPVFFNLFQIQMPVGALTSITHRVTGIVLVLGIPYGVYLLDLSLQSPQSFAQLTGLFHQWRFKAAAVVFIWALAHHLLAGTRHLLSDIDIGSLLPVARRSAWIVNVGGVAVALLAVGVLFGVGYRPACLACAARERGLHALLRHIPAHSSHHTGKDRSGRM